MSNYLFGKFFCFLTLCLVMSFSRAGWSSCGVPVLTGFSAPKSKNPMGLMDVLTSII